MLAYKTDNTGFRQFVLAVKDLRTGKMLPDRAERVGSITWANDNKTIFYTVEDATTKRDNQVFRHTVGTTGADTLAYEEKDEKFNVFTTKSRSKAYIFLFSGSHTTARRVTFLQASPSRNGKSSSRASRTWNISPNTTATFSTSA